MPRLSLFTLFAISLASLIQAKPLGQELWSHPGNSTTPRPAESWAYVNCGTPTDDVQIEWIQISPDPPEPGRDLTVKVKARVTETVEDGAYANVVAKVGVIKLLQRSFDICEEARKIDSTVQCPVQPGTYEVQHTVALPREIPRAKYTVNVRGYTAKDDDLLCLDFKIDFMKHPFPK